LFRPKSPVKEIHMAYMTRVRFVPGRSRIQLRELAGHDEREVGGASTTDAMALLDGLLLPVGGEAGQLGSEDLTAADRDRLLAVVYQRTFGDRIDNTIGCQRCGQPFEIDFSLQAVVDSLEKKGAHPRAKALGGNRFETEAGIAFRVPTGRDERTIAAVDPSEAEAALLRCCLPEDSTAVSAAVVEELLAEIAPLVELELEARCPECGHTHALQFDIQSYLLQALMGDQKRLTWEIHRLAATYGWSLGEILSLTRRERRSFVELIENENVRSR
jgi:hypothetical protein